MKIPYHYELLVLFDDCVIRDQEQQTQQLIVRKNTTGMTFFQEQDTVFITIFDINSNHQLFAITIQEVISVVPSEHDGWITIDSKQYREPIKIVLKKECQISVSI